MDGLYDERLFSHPMNQQPEMPKAHVQVKNPYLALMGLYLGGFTGMYSETSLNIALPHLSAAFGVDISIVQWLVVGYMLVIGLVLPFSSLLTKWFPARKLTLFALGAFAVGALISGFSSTFAGALVGRCIQGIGTGIVLPIMFAMVMEVVPPHKIGAAMGTTALVIMVAPVVGPTLSGILIAALGWRWVFFSFVFFLAIGMVFTAKFMVNPYELTKPKVDVASAVLSCLGFGGIVLGSGIASDLGWLSAPVIVSLIVGIVSLAVYIRRQLASDAPILNLRAFATRGFANGSIAVMANFGITLSVMYILPQFYQNAMGLPVDVAGLLLLPGGIANMLASVAAGRIFDRVGARVPAITGFVLSIASGLLLATCSPATPVWLVVVFNILCMIGVPLAMSPMQTHALASLPPRLNTDGSTIMNTGQQVLGAIATAVSTSLLTSGSAAYLAQNPDANALAFTAGSREVFVFAVVLGIVGFFFGSRLKAADLGAAAAAPNESAPADATATVSDLMHRDVYALHAAQTASDALQLFTEKGISGAPVLNETGDLVGFLSEGDIMRTLATQEPRLTSIWSIVIERNNESISSKVRALLDLPVTTLATKNVITVDVRDRMADVCQTLTDRNLKKAPVMSEGKMVGVINRSDITAYVAGLLK